jgi:hypothetical protein
MFDVEITEGFDGGTMEKLGTCMSEIEACKMVRGWAEAHPERGPCNPCWRYIFVGYATVIDYGSYTHFGRIARRNQAPQTAVKQKGAAE